MVTFTNSTISYGDYMGKLKFFTAVIGFFLTVTATAAGGKTMDVKVIDFQKPGMSDSQCVQAALYATRNAASRTIIFSGRDFLLNESVKLPSDTTVIIDNCMVKQADYTFDNIFCGANFTIDPIDPHGDWLDMKPVKNIRIIGKGKAVVSGCDKNVRIYHPFFKEEQDGVGDGFGWRTHLFHFAGVENIEIGNLEIIQGRCWAICIGMSKKGHIHDIKFDNRSKNGDGIDLRAGCSEFLIENISGYTKDDTVALNAGPAGYVAEKPLTRYYYSLQPWEKFLCKPGADPRDRDIHDVTIRNLNVSGFFHAVILLSLNDTNIYNVKISNIRDTGSRNFSLVDFYTGYGFGEGYVPGNIHDITVENVDGNSDHHPAIYRGAVVVELPVKNVNIRNVRNRGTGNAVIVTHPEGVTVSEVNKDGISNRLRPTDK